MPAIATPPIIKPVLFMFAFSRLFLISRRTAVRFPADGDYASRRGFRSSATATARSRASYRRSARAARSSRATRAESRASRARTGHRALMQMPLDQKIKQRGNDESQRESFGLIVHFAMPLAADPPRPRYRLRCCYYPLRLLARFLDSPD